MMKIPLLLLASSALFGQVPAHTQHYPNIKTGTVLYGAMGLVPASTRPAVNQWMSEHFDMIIGGGDAGDPHGTNPTKVYWTAYVDFAHIYNTEMYRLQDSAVANSFDMESMLIHSSIDMQYTSGAQFQNINRFDAFEPLYNGTRVAGVFTDVGGTFADVTATNPVTVSDTLYVGYQSPFDQMNFTIITARVGGSVAYEYWNGSAWTALTTGFSDGTSGLTSTGQVYFYPPSNWTQRTLTVNVSTPQPIVTTNSKYWIRVVVTGESTSPAYSTVLGDDWAVASGSNTLRGWDAAASGRINVGTPLEYNPSPPAGSTAKFKYQSRVTFIGINVVYGNPSYNPGGVNAWGKFMQEEVSRQITVDNPFDGAFFDDQGQTATNSIASPANPSAYFDYNQGSTWLTEVTASAVAAETYLKAEHGSNFSVGGNGFLPSTPVGEPIVLNYSLQEAFWSAPTTYAPSPVYTVAGINPYDWFLPGVTNPNSNIGYFQCSDTWSLSLPWDISSGGGYTYWHYKDNGNRSPMECLAMHYLGANVNTGMMYGGAAFSYNFYGGTDQVYTYEADTTTTTAITADSSSAAKVITIASNATCTDGYLLKIGGRNTGGDIIAGATGRVSFSGVDYARALRAGVSGTTFSAWPNVIMFGDSATFTTLTFAIYSATVQYPGLEAVVWEYWNGSAWATLTVTDGTNQLVQDGSITFTAPGNWATTSDGTFTGYYVRATTYSLLTVRQWYSSQWHTFRTTSPIFNSYSSGVQANCVREQHQALITSPASNDVYAWARWFPAMGVDIGTETVARQIPWKTGGAPDNISGQASCPLSTSCADVWRRDFTNAVVLFRPWKNTMIESELDTYSHSISLSGTYYPLYADGTTGAGITSITMRGGEGAVLMNNPVSVRSSGLTGTGGVTGKASLR